MIPFEWVEEATRRLAPFITVTPITYDEDLNLFLKWENHQLTGSFKLRGALNKVLSLQGWELKRGLVTCSAGNHGQGVAYAAKIVKASCTVFASDHAVPAKIEAMQTLGAEVITVTGGYVQAEQAAITYSLESAKTFVSPYNDGQVIAGQASLMREVLDQMPSPLPFESILVPVGGGGLISGTGIVIRKLANRPELIGVQSEASPFAHQLLVTGSQQGVIETESIADGLAGEIDHASITIPMMREYVDRIILVSEEQIRYAIHFAWVKYGEKLEGSAAVTLAARLAGKIDVTPALCIMTGGNIQPSLFQEINHHYHDQGIT